MSHDTKSTSDQREERSSGNEHDHTCMYWYVVAGIGLILFTGVFFYVVTGEHKPLLSGMLDPSGAQQHSNNNFNPVQPPESYRTVSAPKLNSRLIQKGEKIYQNHCSACHGESGTGDGPVSTGLKPKPRAFSSAYLDQVSDQYLFWRISEGKPGTAMPAFKQVLTQKERWCVIQYVHSIAENQ